MGFWFAHRFAQGFAYTIWRKSAPYSWNCRKKFWVWSASAWISTPSRSGSPAKKLLEHRPLVVITGGVAGLAVATRLL
jgi:hypothetical protein